MKRVSCLLLLVAGCSGDNAMGMDGGGGALHALADAATVAALSADQKFLAYYTSTGVLATVSLVRAADCTGNACNGIQLDTGAVVTAMISSLDGKYAAYVKKTGSGFMAKYETWLVSIADGKKMMVASSGSLIGYAP